MREKIKFTSTLLTYVVHCAFLFLSRGCVHVFKEMSFYSHLLNKLRKNIAIVRSVRGEYNTHLFLIYFFLLSTCSSTRRELSLYPTRGCPGIQRGVSLSRLFIYHSITISQSNQSSFAFSLSSFLQQISRFDCFI